MTITEPDRKLLAVDAIVTELYRRFKDWNKRGFGPDDVTWCEVKADIQKLVAKQCEEHERRVTELMGLVERAHALMCLAIIWDNLPTEGQLELTQWINDVEHLND